MRDRSLWPVLRAFREEPPNPDETDRLDRSDATGTVIDGRASRNHVTGAVIYKPALVDLITS